MRTIYVQTGALTNGPYRYSLGRTWRRQSPWVLFVMLNPSVADAAKDDPTIRRCVNFARAWGYGGIRVVNLFAYRATDPSELNAADDPVGPENDGHIVTESLMAEITVAAWGRSIPRKFEDRASEVLKLLLEKSVPRVYCIGMNADGSPKHPLYAPTRATRRVYVERKK